MTACPCCGHDLGENVLPIERLRYLDLSANQRAMIDALVEVYPNGMHPQRVVDRMYADDPEGGPDRAYEAARYAAYDLRKKLEPYGWTIPRNTQGRGAEPMYRLASL